VSDEDLETLENYLDGALSPREAERVTRRLALDLEYADAADRLRAERAVRQAVWQSIEPDPAAAHAAGRAAVISAARAERSTRRARLARRAAGVAAGLLVAFAGGWVARGRSAPTAAAPPGAPVGEFQVALTDDGGNIIAVQHFSDPGQARQFAEDVGRWQSGPRRDERRDSPGDFSQVSDEF
jgi:anti-sigma factor RsiW